MLAKALSREGDDEKKEMGVVAQGIAKEAEILTQPYVLVATNVPYLKGGDHGERLKNFVSKTTQVKV